jgi:CubicO group peptidase (beta-lactamase class C family)
MNRGVAATMATVPLVFEPGSGPWLYGTGLDWVGRLVERLNNKTLEEYIQTHICAPLALNSTTFHPQQRPELLSRLVLPSKHNASSGKLETITPSLPDITGEYGGSGLYSSPNDFGRLLATLLHPSSAARVGIAETLWEEIFTPQLLKKSTEEQDTFPALMKSQFRSVFGISHLPMGVSWDYGLAGSLLTADAGRGMRKAGSYQWSGMPNLVFVS